MFVFDVFGTKMSIIKQDEQWLLFKESTTSIRSRVYDVIIPEDLNPQDFRKYLDDFYHEYSTEKHPEVTLVSGGV